MAAPPRWLPTAWRRWACWPLCERSISPHLQPRMAPGCPPWRTGRRCWCNQSSTFSQLNLSKRANLGARAQKRHSTLVCPPPPPTLHAPFCCFFAMHPPTRSSLWLPHCSAFGRLPCTALMCLLSRAPGFCPRSSIQKPFRILSTPLPLIFFIAPRCPTRPQPTPCHLSPRHPDVPAAQQLRHGAASAVGTSAVHL
jgi:hypothetical protein